MRVLIAPHFFKQVLAVGKGRIPFLSRWRIAVSSLSSLLSFNKKQEH